MLKKNWNQNDHNNITDLMKSWVLSEMDEESSIENMGGWFASIGFATRKSFASAAVVKSNTPSCISKASNLVSRAGPVFNSSAVRNLYNGALGFSGLSIMIDIATKTMDAKPDKRLNTIAYFSIFHIPVSLVIPALVAPRVVSVTRRLFESKKLNGFISARTKSTLPVAVALLALFPIVPITKDLAEAVLEPSLGKWLGLEKYDFLEYHHHRHIGGWFSGFAASSQSLVRTLGQTRPLAFMSEGGVAIQSMIPSFAYYGAWGVSGVAVVADIATKAMDAPPEKQAATVAYFTTFHIPASMVVPALIIHRIVHTTQHLVNASTRITPRVKSGIPGAVALLAIIPVVPVVDHISEMLLQPTIGKLVGLTEEDFDKYHHGNSKK